MPKKPDCTCNKCLWARAANRGSVHRNRQSREAENQLQNERRLRTRAALKASEAEVSDEELDRRALAMDRRQHAG